MGIRDKYPFLMKYFESGVNMKDKNVAHCILFYGSDLQSQYDLAMEIARMLNCTGTHTSSCQCLNCNWIRENQHPAVLTISKVDNKPEDDKSSTVISIKQAREIKNNLLVTSDYHRVFIFCDRDKDGNIQGLNIKNFTYDAVNALLKSFEEPPSRTTFFFLTKDKTDIVSTVVSRAQCFFVPSKLDEERDFGIVKDAVDGYLELERAEVLDLNDKILALTKENDPSEVFTQIESYMAQMLKQCIDNPTLKIKLIADLKSVEKAKKELRLNMNIQTIVENLCYDLVLNN